MDILIDTNIILDNLWSRQPYSQNAGEILRLCYQQDCKGHIAAHSITNIFYILRSQFSVSDRKKMLLDLCDFIDVVGIQKKQIIDALNNKEFIDLEDSLQFECAQMINADYIVTRNIADFPNSPIPVILPEDFLKIIKEQK
ncbi:MAG: PIN domain-containing protein [Treponema sp.]|nr:PIN domain-containing protein [Treponema sp.]